MIVIALKDFKHKGKQYFEGQRIGFINEYAYKLIEAGKVYDPTKEQNTPEAEVD